MSVRVNETLFRAKRGSVPSGARNLTGMRLLRCARNDGKRESARNDGKRKNQFFKLLLRGQHQFVFAPLKKNDEMSAAFP